MAKASGKARSGGDLVVNRQARHRYELLDRIECGVSLRGTEVKALREGGAQMKDAYADIRRGELWLRNLHISQYGPASRENHPPERPRKLLIHRHELDRLVGQMKQKGLTIVPTRIYPKGQRIKVEVATARGKNVRDKREDLKRRDQEREMQRAVREARR